MYGKQDASTSVDVNMMTIEKDNGNQQISLIRLSQGQPTRYRTRRRRQQVLRQQQSKQQQQQQRHHHHHSTSIDNTHTKMPPSLLFTSLLKLVVITLLTLFTISTTIITNNFALAAKLPDIYWNASNPIFRTDNSDHIFDVNKKQHDHDQVDLVCPQATQQQVADTALVVNRTDAQERYIIYSVSKDEYDTCRLNGLQQARPVAVCEPPHQQHQASARRPPVTITFRSFTPQPNGLEFKPGQDYYFITALHGHSHDSARKFAPCREQNMKVIFRICCKSSTLAQTNNAFQSQQQQQASRAKLLTSQSALASGVSSSSSTRPSVVTVRPTFKPSTLAATGSLAGFFNQLTAAGAANNQQQQQQAPPQPVTVLPLEVITQEPAQDAPAQQQQADSATHTPAANDIQNEQPASGSSTTTTRERHAPVRPPPFTPFDPRAPPADLLDRYPPTPLPARVHAPPAVLPAGQLKPAPWHLPPPPPPLSSSLQVQHNQRARQSLAPTPIGGDFLSTGPFLGGGPSEVAQQQQQQQVRGLHSASNQQQQHSSRIGLYPWSSGANNMNLITVAPQQTDQQQQQQQQQAGNVQTNLQAPTFALALLVPLLALAILLALGLERRFR